jgi:hypothetical protein
MKGAGLFDHNRPDIAEGLASVYLKFQQLKALHQQSTLNHQLLQKGAATALVCGGTTPNPPANGSNASRNGWRMVDS